MVQPDEFTTALGDRLRLAREQAGLSQTQVAGLMKLHRPTVSEIEAGRRQVTAVELKQFAELYDVDISWLTSGSEEGTEPEIELAARQLAKLKKGDLETVLKLLRTLKRGDRKR